MDIAADVATEVKTHTKQAGQNAIAGVQGFGAEFFKQLFGSGVSAGAVKSGDDIKQMKQADQEFSDAAYLQTRAKVTAMYDQYRQKRLQEHQAQKQAEEVREQKLAALRGEKKMEKGVVVSAQTKASAETGKNYGAE